MNPAEKGYRIRLITTLPGEIAKFTSTYSQPNAHYIP